MHTDFLWAVTEFAISGAIFGAVLAYLCAQPVYQAATGWAIGGAVCGALWMVVGIQ